ncbi:MAG: DUF892 family protein, partial [Verrucomicrobiaceae bacterium]
MPAPKRCKTVDFTTWHFAICALIVHIAPKACFQFHEIQPTGRLPKATHAQSVQTPSSHPSIRWHGCCGTGAALRGTNKPTKDMITNLEQLYYNQIRDLYSAETQLLGMLPQMAAHATCRELRDAFKDRLQETHTHCARLGEISERHGILHDSVPCEAMKGLILETKKHLTET